MVSYPRWLLNCIDTQDLNPILDRHSVLCLDFPIPDPNILFALAHLPACFSAFFCPLKPRSTAGFAQSEGWFCLDMELDEDGQDHLNPQLRPRMLQPPVMTVRSETHKS